MFDWNDLRYFLAVVREGSTLAASRKLRVSQTTVARRVEALEEALGLTLFDKLRAGYAATEAAAGLVELAQRAEAAMAAFETQASSSGREITGTVRLTTNEMFANHVLVDALSELRRAYPGIRLEIISTDRLLDLAAGEADIALRAAPRPTQPNLVGRRIGPDIWSVYCSRAYEARHGKPCNVQEMAAHPVIGIERGIYGGPIAAWFDNAVPESSITFRRNSIEGLYVAISKGLGVSMMSDIIAAANPDFVQCFTPQIDQRQEFWLLTHERVRDAPRVRAVVDFLADMLARTVRVPEQR